MLSVLVISMFLGAALKMLPVDLAETVHSRDKEAAVQAARSGANYAWSRLQENIHWRGDGNAVMVDTPSLHVVEDHGNVVGTLTAQDGTKSQFQIRFSAQDGNQDPGFFLDTPWVSLNNLSGSARAQVARPTSGGGHYPVSGSSPTESVPRFCADIRVIGLAGQGCQSDAPADTARCQVQVADTVLCREEMAIHDSVLYAAGGFAAQAVGSDSTQTEGKIIVDSTDDRMPGIRVISGDMTVQGQFVANKGVQFTLGPGGQVSVSGGGTYSPGHESFVQQDPHWPRLTFNSLVQQNPADTHVPGGTYVWHENASGTRELHYYDTAFDGNLPSGPPTQVLANPTDLSALPGFSGTGLDLEPGSLTTVIRGKVHVSDSPTGVSSFAVVADSDLLLAGNRPLQYFDSSNSQQPALVANSGSDSHIVLTGCSKGKGSLASSGQIGIQASSVFEADPESNIALYARGDVNILPPPSPQISLYNTFFLGNTFQLNVSSLSSDTRPQAPKNFNNLSLSNSLTDSSAFSYPFQNSALSLASGAFSTDPTYAQASSAVQSSFDPSATTAASGLDLAGNPVSLQITTPLFLQFLQVQPPFPLTPSDVAFSGVVYAQGGVNANLGKSNFFLNGVLTAYGGDPAGSYPGGSPRAPSKRLPSAWNATSSIFSLLPTNRFLTAHPTGKVDLKVGNAQFLYDPASLVPRDSSISSAKLALIFLAVH